MPAAFGCANSNSTRLRVATTSSMISNGMPQRMETLSTLTLSNGMRFTRSPMSPTLPRTTLTRGRKFAPLVYRSHCPMRYSTLSPIVETAENPCFFYTPCGRRPITSLTQQLATLVTECKGFNSNKQYDINILSEHIALHLFRELYDYKYLRNLN